MYYKSRDSSLIIAECSQNFTNLAEATGLLNLAKLNGADLVKFQLFDSTKLYKEKSPAELSFEDARDLFDYGFRLGIEVFFSVFDVERVKWCEEIGVKRYKIAYGQRDNWELINFIPRRKQLIISTDIIGSSHYTETKWLCCAPHYPAQINEYMLNKMSDFDGISDHTIGIDCAKIALARGAEIIEKHFAIDHNTGIDAPWSMTPSELRELKRWETVCKEAL